MNVGTRTRSKVNDTPSSSSNTSHNRTRTPPHEEEEEDEEKVAVEIPAGGTTSTKQQPVSEEAENEENTELVSIPAQNIKQFKEAVVNTSRLLKVFSDQEKDLAKTKAEVTKYQEDAKRMQQAQQSLQREIEARKRELNRANTETKDVRALLIQREKELSRVRGQKEDLETKINELNQIEPTVNQPRHATPPVSPDTSLLEEIERLKKDIEAKDGSLKAIRISRDSIRSSTKAEVMSIQARYAREQIELIERQEKEKAQYRQSLASKETEIEKEQERLMQMEMDLEMRSSQLEEQTANLKSGLEGMTAKHKTSQLDVKKLNDLLKSRGADHRAEVNKLNRTLKREEKRVADLESALKRAQAQAKDNAKAKVKHKPKSTATAADAISAATEDVAEMGIDELRNEVSSLRIDAVHKDETIRKYGVMVEELERKQNPEGRRPRGRATALQAEIDELKSTIAARDQKVEVLEAALQMSNTQEDASSGPLRTEGDNRTSNMAATVAQQSLRVLSLETEVKDKERTIEDLKRQIKEAKESAEERPMRLRHSSAASITSPSPTRTIRSHNDDHDAISSLAKSGGRKRSSLSGAGRATKRKIDDSQHEDLYTEIAMLRARINKLQQEKIALQELVTEQQVKLRQLRVGGEGGLQQTEETTLRIPNMDEPSTQTQQQRPLDTLASPQLSLGSVRRKRIQQAVPAPGNGKVSSGDATAVAARAKRPKNNTSAAAAAAKQLAISGDVNSETIERLIRDKRINSANRTRRLADIMEKSPSTLYQTVVKMTESVAAIDASEFLKLLIQQISANVAKPGNQIKVLPNSQITKLMGSSTVCNLLAGSSSDAGLPMGLYEDEAIIAMSVWVLSMKNEQTKFFGELLQQLTQAVIAPPAGCSVDMVCSLARMFAMFAWLSQDIQRARVLLCDLLMDAVDGPHSLPVLSNVLAVWPSVLAMPDEQQSEFALSLVARVFQAIAAGIHDLYAEERSRSDADALYSVMVERCGWRQADDAEFADRLLLEVKAALQDLNKGDSRYPIVMCAYNLLAPYVVEKV